MKKTTLPSSTIKQKPLASKPVVQKPMLSANLAHEIADLYNLDNIGLKPEAQGVKELLFKRVCVKNQSF